MALPHATEEQRDDGTDTRIGIAHRPSELLPVENILLEVNIPSKKRLFEEMGRLFERHCGLPALKVQQALEEREAMGSTGLGHGVAIPHARLHALGAPVAAYVRPRMPLAFGAPDGKPVSDILVLLVPQQSAQKSLDILSGAARLFSDRGFRDELNRVEEPAEVHRVIRSRMAQAA